MITVIYNDGSEEQVKDFSEVTIMPGSGSLLFLNGKQIQRAIGELDYMEIMKRVYMAKGIWYVTTTGV